MFFQFSFLKLLSKKSPAKAASQISDQSYWEYEELKPKGRLQKKKTPNFYNEAIVFTENNDRWSIKWNFQYDMKGRILQWQLVAWLELLVHHKKPFLLSLQE